MQKICECRVAPFGAKLTGYVLEILCNEDHDVFVVKKNSQKEVEDHLEYESKEFIRLDSEKTKNISLENLLKLAKEELIKKTGKDEELAVSSMILHTFCAAVSV